MGEVFLGEARDGQRAAVKLLRAEFATDPGFRQRFSREVTAAKRVSSPQTARVIEADPKATRPWFASEFVPGRNLQEHVAQHGLFDAAATAALGAGLAEGLGTIHASDLIHRDLKPSNIIVSVHGPVIIDFGISRAIDASTLTATGMVLGTYGYMSPEQITGDTATPASDVFALGCVLAFAANGTGPFHASTVPGIIHRIISEPPKLGTITGELRAVIECCVEKDPAERPSTAALVEWLTELGTQVGANTKIDPDAGVFPDSGFSPGHAEAKTEVTGEAPTQVQTDGDRTATARPIPAPRPGDIETDSRSAASSSTPPRSSLAKEFGYWVSDHPANPDIKKTYFLSIVGIVIMLMGLGPGYLAISVLTADATGPKNWIHALLLGALAIFVIIGGGSLAASEGKDNQAVENAENQPWQAWPCTIDGDKNVCLLDPGGAAAKTFSTEMSQQIWESMTDGVEVLWICGDLRRPVVMSRPQGRETWVGKPISSTSTATTRISSAAMKNAIEAAMDGAMGRRLQQNDNDSR